MIFSGRSYRAILRTAGAICSTTYTSLAFSAWAYTSLHTFLHVPQLRVYLTSPFFRTTSNPILVYLPTHIRFINLFHQCSFFHPFYMFKSPKDLFFYLCHYILFNAVTLNKTQIEYIHNLLMTSPLLTFIPGNRRGSGGN